MTLKIEVSGFSVSCSTAGQGATTVLLETGLGAESEAWKPVADALEPHARVVWYDRVGRGESDVPRRPRSTRDMVDDLRALLDTLSERRALILVGHSFGGFIAKAFAARYPKDVIGLVLAESMHRDQFDALGPLFPDPREDDPPQFDDMRRFWRGGWRDPEATPERIDFQRVFREDAAITTLNGLPMRVVTAGPFLNAPHLQDGARERLQEKWLELQKHLSTLSTRARHVLLPESGHFLQQERPDAIATAVLELLPAR